MTAQISFTGNATADAELRFGSSGVAIASFTVAVTPREKQPDGSWGDGPAAFYRVSAFKSLGENAAESVHKGDRVTVVGQLKPREYEHNGQTRTSLDVLADSVALDLRWATATTTKAQKRVGNGTDQSSGGWGQQQPTQPQQPGWGGAPTQQGQWDQGAPF